MAEAVTYKGSTRGALATSLSANVAAEVGREIVTGHYQPGSLVEDESALSERFAVSRTVIRDAIKMLVGKGLLDVRRGIGTRVRPREEWALLDNDVLAWHLSTTTDTNLVFQLDEIRRLFEPQAAGWAAARATAEDVALIADALESMQACVSDTRAYLAADARFHRAILRATHNDFLLALSGIIHTALLSSIRLINPDRHANQTAMPFHQAVFDAIEAGDEAGAHEAMTRLVAEAGRRVRRLVTGEDA